MHHDRIEGINVSSGASHDTLVLRLVILVVTVSVRFGQKWCEVVCSRILLYLEFNFLELLVLIGFQLVFVDPVSNQQICGHAAREDNNSIFVVLSGRFDLLGFRIGGFWVLDGSFTSVSSVCHFVSDKAQRADSVN